MKKLTIGLLAVVVLALFASCDKGPLKVTGTFYNKLGVPTYSGPVNGGRESYSAAFARVNFSGGGVKPEDVRIEPIVSVAKGGAEIAYIVSAVAGAGGIVSAAVTYALGYWGFGPGDHSFPVTINTEDGGKEVSVGKSFVFFVLPESGEGEGEGEGQIEGEGEDQYSPTLSNISPTGSSLTVISGDSITVSARINGQHQCRVVLISPEGKEADETISPPEYFSKTFSLNSVGYGDVSLRVTDQVNDLFVERKWSVTILSAIEGEGQSEGQIEGEGEGENTVGASVSITSPLDGTVFDLTGTPPSKTFNLVANIGEAGVGPTDIVIVTPEGDVFRKTVTPPAMITQTITLTLKDTGLISVRATPQNGGTIAEGSVAVTTR